MINTIKHHLLLGAHVSVSGGLHKAFERAAEIGCSAMQIFTKNNQQWYAKKLLQEDIGNFLEAQKKYTNIIKVVAVHSSYLINICSENSDSEKKSIEGLIIELQRCEQLEIPYLIMHPGTGGKQERKTALLKLKKNLDIVLKESNGTTMLLLENMAGQGTSIGNNFEELGEVIESANHSKQLGLCIDTCHTFAAGYDFTTEENYEMFVNMIEKTVGLKKLKMFHINDSKKELGSRVDRHANIGKGKIDLQAFSFILNDPRFFDIPKILETPHEEEKDLIPDLKILKSLLTEKTKKLLEYTE